MRVLHIIGTLDPASGGPAASVSMLIEFTGKENESEAVTLDDPSASFLERLPFTVTALGPGITKYGYSSRLVPWLRANRERFDAVVVHGLWQFCGLAAWIALADRKPYYVFVHGMLDPYFKRAFPLKHMKKLLYWVAAEYWVLRGARRVLFTCAEEERLARESFMLRRWSAMVVPYGSRTAPDRQALDERAFFGRFPRIQGRRYLLFLGRIDRKKGCDLLLEAFAANAASDPSLDLVMAGPDETGWRPELERIVHGAGLTDRVHWTGMLEDDAKWSAFACCEAFILPSHQENFGIAVAEALAYGRSVLLSDKVNIARDVEADGAGYVEADTVEGTTRLIRRWIATVDETRRAMETRALACFRTRFDMRENTRIFVESIGDAVRLESDEPVEPVVSAG